MGGGASVNSTTLDGTPAAEAAAAAGEAGTTASPTGSSNKPTVHKPDHALRVALRQLQLSPETIDESVAAIYQHVRNPIDHPVDKELARLCNSEYVRGALHALASYLTATSVLDSVGATGGSAARDASAAKYTNDKRTSEIKSDPSRVGGGPEQTMFWTGRGANKENRVMDTLSTVWNRLTQTHSMQPRDKATMVNGVEDFENSGNEVDDHNDNKSAAAILFADDSNGDKGVDTSSNTGTLPKLRVRVPPSMTPRRIPNSSMSSLGLGSPSGDGRVRDVSPPRRALVRTGRWKLGHEIGKGSFGAVHIGLNEDSGDLIAVKVLSLQKCGAAEPLYREIELMRHLTHPNIVCYLGAEVNDSEKTISIFQEWVPGSVTTLLVNFGPFSDRRIAGYTKQILNGLVYLHKERVIHRDIKGGNILIDDRGVVKLCDFGASKMLDVENITGMGEHTRVGSPLFMAPEILLRQEYGPQVDIWSLGGAVLEMATGQPPWHTLNLRTPVALINWVKRTEGPPPLPEGLSKPLTKFLLRCFERDPTKRATAKQLLSDPFVAESQGNFPPAHKAFSSGSDADSVSDIDTLSRSAAIARIRRASYGEFSRPHSAGGAVGASSFACGDSAATPRSPGAAQQGAGGYGGAETPPGQQQQQQQHQLQPQAGNSKSSVILPVLAQKDGQHQQQQQPSGPGTGAGAETGKTVLPRGGSQGSSPSRTGQDSPSPARPSSLQRPGEPPSLQVVTESLDPSLATPRVTTPKRLSGCTRGSSSSPNPFGGRRRSLDHGDGSRSPRNSTTTAAQAHRPVDHQTHETNLTTISSPNPAPNPGSSNAVAGGMERRGRTMVRDKVVQQDNTDTVVMSPKRVAVATATATVASGIVKSSPRLRHHKSAIQRSNSSGSSGTSSGSDDSAVSEEREGVVVVAAAVAPVSEDTTPLVSVVADAVAPIEEPPQLAARRSPLKPRRAGRGGRPTVGSAGADGVSRADLEGMAWNWKR